VEPREEEEEEEEEDIQIGPSYTYLTYILS
jgi:hypothetical protein